MNPQVIHLTGASGSGTTTLGRAIAACLGIVHLDTDDFFWMPADPPFTVKRPEAKRLELLQQAARRAGRCVLSGSLAGWGDALIPLFERVVYLQTPTPLRLQRLHLRKFDQFGRRILPGGDMHEEHLEFLHWASRYDSAGLEQRSALLHRQWLEQLHCPVHRVDGELPVQENLDLLQILT